MVTTNALEDRMLELIRGRIEGIKLIQPSVAQFDEQLPPELKDRTPFILLMYGGLDVIEEKRLETFGAGLVRQYFHLTIGTNSLRSKREGQIGAYEILQEVGMLFDGQTIDVGGQNVPLGLVDENFVRSEGGLILYGTTYAAYQT